MSDATPEGEDYNIPGEERKEALRKLSQHIRYNDDSDCDVPNLSWAICQVCDLVMLRHLANVTKRGLYHVSVIVPYIYDAFRTWIWAVKRSEVRFDSVIGR